MASELTIRVETEGAITAPSVARFLMSINALHVAAALVSEGGDEVLETMRIAGIITRIQSVMDSKQPKDLVLFGALAALNAVEVQHALPSLNVTAIRRGSLETVLEEIIERLWKKFSSLANVLPSLAERGRAGNEVAARAISDHASAAADAEAFYSVSSIAYANARASLLLMNARRVEIAGPRLSIKLDR